MTPKQIQESLKVLDLLQAKNRTDKERTQLGRAILEKHEIAKQALLDSGRPRERVAAMPHLQVALLHSLLEYDAVLDEVLVSNNLPYTEQAERLKRLERDFAESRRRDQKAPVISLAETLLSYVGKLAFNRVRLDRKMALLRTIEAIRFYAAIHDGKLPPDLAAVQEMPIPRDPMTGQEFVYQVNAATATLRAPPPGNERPNAGDTVVYELQIRQ